MSKSSGAAPASVGPRTCRCRVPCPCNRSARPGSRAAHRHPGQRAGLNASTDGRSASHALTPMLLCRIPLGSRLLLNLSGTRRGERVRAPPSPNSGRRHVAPRLLERFYIIRAARPSSWSVRATALDRLTQRERNSAPRPQLRCAVTPISAANSVARLDEEYASKNSTTRLIVPPASGHEPSHSPCKY